MADTLARVTLARAAARLNRDSGARLPAIIFLTDDARVRDPVIAASRLPRGSLVIVRSSQPARRAEIALGIAAVAKRHGLKWLIANDGDLATRLKADGAHFADSRNSEACHWRACRPHWIITCAAHSLASCAEASRFGANAVLLSPAFATKSHADGKSLGPTRLRLLARQSPIPIYALGGIDATTARQLNGASLAGLAAIGAWVD